MKLSLLYLFISVGNNTDPQLGRVIKKMVYFGSQFGGPMESIPFCWWSPEGVQGKRQERVLCVSLSLSLSL